MFKITTVHMEAFNKPLRNSLSVFLYDHAYQNVLGSLFAEAAQLEPLIPLLRLCGLRLLRSRLALTRRLRASLRLGWAPGVCVSSTSCWATALLPPKNHRGRFSKEAEHTAPPMGHSLALGPKSLDRWQMVAMVSGSPRNGVPWSPVRIRAREQSM